MHVGTLAVFDGAVMRDASGRFRLAEVRRLVASRLHLIPRFRQRLMAVPLEQGRPIWVDDDRFDISFHVRLTAVAKPGRWSQVLGLTARIEAQTLDRRRPLWELWFVEGLEAGRVALVQKTHHALVDGVSGVDVATVLLDFEPDAPSVEAPPWVPVPAPSGARLLADTMVERATERAEMARTVRAIARTPQRSVEGAARIGRAVQALVEAIPLAPRTSLHGAVGRRRSFVATRVSFDDVNLVRGQFGGTVNDVVLAGVAGALRRRLIARGETVPDHLRVLCPVSVRTEEQHGRLGNQVSAMFLDLALAEPDPVARLVTITAATAYLKVREQAAGTAFLLHMTRNAAPTTLGIAAQLVHRQPFVNLVVTNVPGPSVPLYCMGARMTEAFPMVPLSRNLGLGIAILSYCGVLHFGLYADADLHPDLTELGVDLEAAFAELRHAAERGDVDRRASGERALAT